MDGLTANEGIVFVFTTNCSLDLIDRAFRRPGRLDLVLHFQAPDAELRRRMIDRWHADIRAGVDVDVAVQSTSGLSFAELDEVKNLLVMHHADSNEWNWQLAMQQFAINRSELTNKATRRVGYAAMLPASGNGDGHGDGVEPR
jgi:ATP-dependent 26S proteasome regulatory subunit